MISIEPDTAIGIAQESPTPPSMLTASDEFSGHRKQQTKCVLDHENSNSGFLSQLPI